MKNVCIVGYGAIGPTHAKALEYVERARFYAVCDIDAKQRKKCTEKYAVKEFDDYNEVLRDENIHCVHICTPHYLHFGMIKKALAAGKEVVIEKPVTRTREEFETLLTLENADRICVVIQNRLNPCIQKLKDIVQSGTYGKVLGARGILTWSKDEAYYGSGKWRGKWETEGGCLLINQAIHTLDFFSYVVGGIESVKTDMFNYSLSDVIEAEDTLSAYLTFQTGARGVFFATNAYVQDSSPIFEVVFEKVTVRYIDKQLWLNGKIIEEDAGQAVGKSYWGSGHAQLIKQYYDEQKYFTLSDVRNTMETVFDMYQDAFDFPLKEKRTGRQYNRALEIMTYINEHISETLSICNIAEHFFLSTSYLSVIFKKETGMTINKYITSQRIMLAKVRLSEGHSVTETCELCGFKDYSNFLKVFKKTVGISPKIYAKLSEKQ